MSNLNHTAKPGCLLPDILVKEKSIYESLSPTHWTLIVCGKEKIKFQMGTLKILHAPEKTYDSRYILIGPDRKVLLAEDQISEAMVVNCLKKM